MNKRIFVSGAVSNSVEEISLYSHRFSEAIAKALLDNGHTIVSGVGTRFGTHLVGHATDFMESNGIKDQANRLIIRPFVAYGEDASEKNNALREQVILKCDAAIFLFGDYRYVGGKLRKSGVYQEFEIADALGKIIIPIAYPGMVSETIWRKVVGNMEKYPYLKGKVENLTSEYPVAKLAELIVEILK